MTARQLCTPDEHSEVTTLVGVIERFGTRVYRDDVVGADNPTVTLEALPPSLFPHTDIINRQT